ncbi:hypothetical protein [Actinophytocola sp.]|uniref:hypothetical protein n=1 Tax=Actinophytocola sp. TaxID=1872138 RepID=UPI002ED0C510
MQGEHHPPPPVAFRRFLTGSGGEEQRDVLGGHIGPERWFRGPNLAIARLFGRTPAMGALTTPRAATDPAATNGDYF